MRTFFNRDTAPIIGTGRPHTHDRGLNIALHRESVRRNLRKERRMKQVLGEALAIALFTKEFGHKPSPEEKREIIPSHHTSTKNVRVRMEVSIDLSFME